jgi:CheY-like chemotaxis protein
VRQLIDLSGSCRHVRPRRCRVTVINDSSEFVDVVREALGADGCVVTGFNANEVQLDAVVASRPELLIVDLLLGTQQETSGWELMLLARAPPTASHSDHPVLGRRRRPARP